MSPRTTSVRSRMRRAALLAAVALAPFGAAATAHADEFGIRPDSFAVRAYDVVSDGGGGTSEVEVTQAAGRPDYFSVDFWLNQTTTPNGGPVAHENLRNVAVDLPRGFSGNPQATPRCALGTFVGAAGVCPNATMVGVASVRYNTARGRVVNVNEVPVFNITPPDGTVARLAFRIVTINATVDMKINSDGSYRLVSNTSDISGLLYLLGVKLTLFGTPAALNGPGPLQTTVNTYGEPSGAPLVPFIQLPATCDGPLEASLAVNSWQRSERWSRASTTLAARTGCDRLRFSPTLEMRPDSGRAGTPAGYDVRLKVPQASAPGAPLDTPPLRAARVTLPEGVAISPSSADGLTGCTDAQVALGSDAKPDCPGASRVGSVRIDTPVLPGPLTGGVFLGQPKSFDASTGEMLRIFLVAEGHGVTIKQEGKITPDPVTGRLTAVFADTPQLPFSELAIDFDDGPRAPLTNPPTCGTYTTVAELTSWSGQRVSSSSSFAIDRNAAGGPCAPLGFAPSFQAGTTNPAAGSPSPFTLAFGRDDGEQELGDLTADLPAGLMGMVAQADLCGDAAAAAGTCGESSRIGTVAVAAGAGTNPFQLPGRGVYLTGPYKGAPFGLSIVVPAVAGPFDLGTVVVRAAIQVDRRTAALRIVSDPFPSILQGIPLRIRQVRVSIDKPGFMVNPTSCAEKRVGGTLRSTAGATANVASRFQVGGCKALPFTPRIGFRAGTRGRTRRGLTVPFTATLRMRSGQANNRAVTVRLPKVLNARLEVIRNACTLEEFETDRCTKQVGTATATTPVLRDPLRGPVYFVRDPARRLPSLMAALRGQGDAAGVRIDLAGKVSIARDLSLQTAFDTIPDVPISLFSLSLVAGRRGPIGTTENLCAKETRQRALARVQYRAHSGRALQSRPRLQVAGCTR